MYGSDLLAYFLIDMVSLSHNHVLVMILATAYTILALGTCYYAYVATHLDPSDPTIQLEKDCKEKNIPFNSDPYEFHC